jgi:hypothetical protein
MGLLLSCHTVVTNSVFFLRVKSDIQKVTAKFTQIGLLICLILQTIVK